MSRRYLYLVSKLQYSSTYNLSLSGVTTNEPVFETMDELNHMPYFTVARLKYVYE